MIKQVTLATLITAVAASSVYAETHSPTQAEVQKAAEEAAVAVTTTAKVGSGTIKLTDYHVSYDDTSDTIHVTVEKKGNAAIVTAHSDAEDTDVNTVKAIGINGHVVATKEVK